MKKSILLSLLIGMMGVIVFMGCERPEPIEPTNGQQPQRVNEDSLINQQGDTMIILDEDSLSTKITVEHWRASEIGYYNYYDSTYHHNETYTYVYMDVYPQENILFAHDIDSADGLSVLFGNDHYWPYSMDCDTITVEYQYPEYTDYEINMEQKRWLIYHINDTTMHWYYLGPTVGLMDLNYTFYLMGVE